MRTKISVGIYDTNWNLIRVCESKMECVVVDNVSLTSINRCLESGVLCLTTNHRYKEIKSNESSR